jgi:hypothetical protein
MHFLSSLVHTRENFPVSHSSWNCSESSTLNSGVLYKWTFRKKKVYFGGMSILSILLRLKPGCYRDNFFIAVEDGSRMIRWGGQHRWCGFNVSVSTREVSNWIKHCRKMKRRRRAHFSQWKGSVTQRDGMTISARWEMAPGRRKRRGDDICVDVNLTRPQNE